VRNGMSPKLVLSIALTFYGIAAVLGLIITFNSSFWILVVGAVSMAVGYLYTGGPVPISWTPSGEIFVGFLIVTVIIMITFYIHTSNLQTFPLLMSIPPAITIGQLNMANNIRDRKKDKVSGRKTYVILVGKPLAIATAAGLLLFAYLFLIYMACFN